MTTPKTLLKTPEKTAIRGGSAPSRVSLSSRPAPLDEADKVQIHGKWRRGVAPEVLAQQHGRSVAVIDRAINEMRAKRLLEQKLDYVFDPAFEEKDAEERLLAPLPVVTGGRTVRTKAPAGLPPYLASLYGDAPLLSREQEAHLFRKMNYLKYRASQLREGLDPARASTAVLDKIDRFQEEAVAVKNQIIRANLRLVVSIAKKRVGPSGNFFELVSDGNMSLIRAVEKFDAGRGFKFSTYASWAIMKNFARTIPEEKTRRDRFVTGHDEMFESAADHRTGEQEYESDQRRNQEAVQGMLGKLNDRERQILVSRFGLGGASEQTLEQLGKELGITKERVRQIESRAQEKLRKFAMESKIEPPQS